MSSVSDLIHSSFRLIGAIAAGELLETQELNDAFISLNQMIASWSTEGASLVSRQRQLLQMLGQGSAVLPTFPVHIESASVSQQGIDSPLEIVDSAGWESITEKALQSVFAKKLYCDYFYPSATVYLWPIPRYSATLEIWQYTQLAQFFTVNDTINLPLGYEVALRTNFAVLVEPEYPRSQMDPLLPAQAQNYKASLVQLNSMHHMRSTQQSPTQAIVDQSSSSVSQ